MKFEDAYRSANAQVHVRESLKNDIAAQYAKETVKTREHSKRWFVAIPTAVAAAAAVFVAVTVGVNARASQNAAAPMAAADQLFMSEAVEAPAAVPETEEMGDGMLYALGAAPAEAPNVTEAEAPRAAEPEPATESCTEQTDAAVAEDDFGKKNFEVQFKRTGEVDMAVTDGTWNYLLDPETLVISIFKDSETESTVISLSDVETGTVRTENGLLPAGDTLYLFETVESYDEPAETEERIQTVITVYALGDRSSVQVLAKLTQSGAFDSAQLICDTLMITSTYTVKNGDRSERYTVFSEIGAGETDFRAQRVTRRK